MSETKEKLEEKEKLNPQQELFCQYYVKNENAIGNGVKSYAAAYDYSTEKLESESESDFKKRLNTLASAASRLLTHVNISERIRDLLLELFNEKEIDSQLNKVIRQDRHMSAKVDAIHEANLLKQRITEKTDITSGGQPVGLEISEVLLKKKNLPLSEKNSENVSEATNN